MGARHALRAVLQGSRVKTFLAESDLPPGGSLAALRGAILQAHMLVLIWSAQAQSSPWVAQEVGVALGSNKLVLPVVLTPTGELPALLREIKHVRAWENPIMSLPTVQHAVLQWGQYLEASRRAQGAQRSQDDFWSAVGSSLAVVGGVVVLGKLFGTDRAPPK